MSEQNELIKKGLEEDLETFFPENGRTCNVAEIEVWNGQYISVVIIPKLSESSIDAMCNFNIDDNPNQELKYDIMLVVVLNNQKISRVNFENLLFAASAKTKAKEVINIRHKQWLNRRGCIEFHGLRVPESGKFLLKYKFVDI